MMKRSFFGTVAGMTVACTLLASTAHAAPVGSGRSEPEQVAAATMAWATAYNSRQPTQILGAYDNDAMLWGTTARAIAIGPVQIGAYFASAPTRPGARVEIGEQHVRIYGDTAIDSGTYTFSDSHEGVHTIRPARFTMVFTHHDGQWLIVAHHSSLMPAP